MNAVIMAGGSGTRFWPASRRALPKQFLSITGDRTLLEATIDRVRPVAEGAISVVVGKEHAEVTRRLVDGAGVRVIVEPEARNTAACIGLAALHAGRGSGPMAVLPADHFVADPNEFAETLRAAAEVASTGVIVTLGVPPTRPETGYGYLELGAERGHALGRPYASVERFVEKPDTQSAVRYLAGGRHRWNSGVFVFTPEVVLAAIDECLPGLAAALARIGPAIGTAGEAVAVAEGYRSTESVSIDTGVMERTRTPIVALDAAFGWSDVGSWEALFALRAPEEGDGSGNLLLGDAEAVDARGNLVFSTTGRAIALLGVEGLVVADTPDALLVADLRRSQEVKVFADRFRARGRDDVS